MSDGAKGAVGQIVSDVGEAVVTPVINEVRQAVSEGLETALGGGPQPQDPAAVQQKQLEKLKKQQWEQAVIEKNRRFLLEESQKLRQLEQQEVAEQKQQEQQEKRVKQFKVVSQRQDLTAAQQAQRKTEQKRGVGS